MKLRSTRVVLDPGLGPPQQTCFNSRPSPRHHVEYPSKSVIQSSFEILSMTKGYGTDGMKPGQDVFLASYSLTLLEMPFQSIRSARFLRTEQKHVQSGFVRASCPELFYT